MSPAVRYVFGFLGGLLASGPLGLFADQPEIKFNRDIRPLLSDRCFKCHGPDSQTREAGLRLDRSEAAVAELDSGERAIVPSDLEQSELVRRIRSTDPDLQMPPPDSGKQLSDREKELLEKWVREGAVYQPHWSFVPPQRTEPPTVKNEDWSKNPIDRFVLARIESAGLQPSSEAPREKLIRRAALDLTGLPPTPEEMKAFFGDSSPDAYQRMVDRYLASPAYGEHLARTWLDLARYADSNGYQYDTERQQWVWRDWVIDAFNRNMPFDQFTIEQIAGDLLPGATPQQRLATGFNRNHGVTIEGGVIDEEYRTEYVIDRVATTGGVWLGLTLTCARCHDHKFDPISQKDFYQLMAFFNQVPERGMNGFDPQERIASPLGSEVLEKYKQQLRQLRAELEVAQASAKDEFVAWAERQRKDPATAWQILKPTKLNSTGGSTLTLLDDQSVLVGGANPQHDVYELTATTEQTGLTAVRLEALTHPSLPGGGPGRHTNSNFVLSEFELTAVSKRDPRQSQIVKFVRAEADYNQENYNVAKAIDGTVAGNSGWAVDGPSRKEPATALFVGAEPFGYDGGTELHIRLRHEANFSTHSVGRARLAVTSQAASEVSINGLPAEIQELVRRPLGEFTAEQRAKLETFYFEVQSARGKALLAEIARVEQEQQNAFPPTMIMREQETLRPTFVLNRGQYDQPTEPVSAGVPAVFPQLSSEEKPNRLAFARWLVSPQHPLTARVAVNRIWQRLFGVGLVKTSEDFGLQGELPSDPELLDWLATEYIRSGWDTKALYRLILTSATYRQTSDVGRDTYLRDPDNRLLARGPRFRLEAEEVRDAALAVSGLLVNKLGGPSVYPYQPPGLWTELNNRPGYSTEYPQGKGEQLYRRSLYSFWKRTVPLPMLKILDAPDREVCTLQRSRTNTPLQALLLWNAPQFVEAARHLALRMLEQPPDAESDPAVVGFKLVTGREARAEELAVMREHFAAERARFAADEAAAKQLLGVGDSPLKEGLSLVDYAAWTSVARMLLNLDEFITKE
ncbi:MAG: PSD1 and planctomycete cytochrome C domain-containing protein [Planctomycetota bacterium]